MAARAYLNHGRWVADCPVPYCASAEALTPGQVTFHCSYCRGVAPVDWPDNADDLWDALQERPVPATRNWFPPGHNLALRSGSPHGQTVRDLRDETAEHQGGQ